jgi:hypothetical protein
MAKNAYEKMSVDEVIEGLPPNEKKIVKRLRALILDALPQATEKNSYGVPFYTRNRMMLFIWPPSIYWGPKKKELNTKGVTLGFSQGYLMSNDDGVLLAEGRKQVYCMYFHDVKEIHDEQLRALFFEAELIDQQFRKRKTKSGNR